MWNCVCKYSKDNQSCCSLLSSVETFWDFHSASSSLEKQEYCSIDYRIPFHFHRVETVNFSQRSTWLIADGHQSKNAREMEIHNVSKCALRFLSHASVFLSLIQFGTKTSSTILFVHWFIDPHLFPAGSETGQPLSSFLSLTTSYFLFLSSFH